MNITITKKENPGKLPETDELGFGKYFTDHMFLMDYSDTDGWHNARIVPFGPVSMSPAPRCSRGSRPTAVRTAACSFSAPGKIWRV